MKVDWEWAGWKAVHGAKNPEVVTKRNKILELPHIARSILL